MSQTDAHRKPDILTIFFLLSGHYEADIDIPKTRLLRWLQQPSSHQKIISGDMKTGEKNSSDLEKVL